MKKTIELGEGIGGKLLFGSRFEDVRKILGEPDQIENSQLEEGGGDTVAWVYNKHGLTLYFDEEDEWRLGTIEADAKDCTLNGEKLIGRSFSELKKVLESMKIGKIEEELDAHDDFDDVEMRLLYSEENCINIWFEDDICSVVQWSPF